MHDEHPIHTDQEEIDTAEVQDIRDHHDDDMDDIYDGEEPIDYVVFRTRRNSADLFWPEPEDSSYESSPLRVSQAVSYDWHRGVLSPLTPPPPMNQNSMDSDEAMNIAHHNMMYIRAQQFREIRELQSNIQQYRADLSASEIRLAETRAMVDQYRADLRAHHSSLVVDDITISLLPSPPPAHIGSIPLPLRSPVDSDETVCSEADHLNYTRRCDRLNRTMTCDERMPSEDELDEPIDLTVADATPAVAEPDPETVKATEMQGLENAMTSTSIGDEWTSSSIDEALIFAENNADYVVPIPMTPTAIKEEQKSTTEAEELKTTTNPAIAETEQTKTTPTEAEEPKTTTTPTEAEEPKTTTTPTEAEKPNIEAEKPKTTTTPTEAEEPNVEPKEPKTTTTAIAETEQKPSTSKAAAEQKTTTTPTEATEPKTATITAIAETEQKTSTSEAIESKPKTTTTEAIAEQKTTTTTAATEPTASAAIASTSTSFASAPTPCTSRIDTLNTQEVPRAIDTTTWASIALAANPSDTESGSFPMMSSPLHLIVTSSSESEDYADKYADNDIKYTHTRDVAPAAHTRDVTPAASVSTAASAAAEDEIWLSGSSSNTSDVVCVGFRPSGYFSTVELSSSDDSPSALVDALMSGSSRNSRSARRVDSPTNTRLRKRRQPASTFSRNSSASRSPSTTPSPAKRHRAALLQCAADMERYALTNPPAARQPASTYSRNASGSRSPSTTPSPARRHRMERYALINPPTAIKQYKYTANNTYAHAPKAPKARTTRKYTPRRKAATSATSASPSTSAAATASTTNTATKPKRPYKRRTPATNAPSPAPRVINVPRNTEPPRTMIIPTTTAPASSQLIVTSPYFTPVVTSPYFPPVVTSPYFKSTKRRATKPK